MITTSAPQPHAAILPPLILIGNSASAYTRSGKHRWIIIQSYKVAVKHMVAQIHQALFSGLILLLNITEQSPVCNHLAGCHFAIMLDAFEIMTTSGVVLWSKCDVSFGSQIVNDLINDAFIEEKARPQGSNVETGAPVYKKEKYSLKWRRVKDFGLIFVVSCTFFRCFPFCKLLSR